MEEAVKNITVYVSLLLEAVAALVIAAALLKLIWNYARIFHRDHSGYSVMEARLGFGTAMAVSLELLLGADVLETAIAPNWDDIGQLAAVATIRTALNYFLEKELRNSKSVA